MATPLKLLLIEDSAADEKMLLRELRLGGFAPTCCRVETAEEMERALAMGGWDMILSDYRLPTFTGAQALSILKNSRYDIPFILVSGTIGELNAVDAMLAGASDYVMKDNIARLIPAIRRELEDAHVRADRRHAVASLAESEARFRNMADSAPMLLWISNASGDLVYVNRQYQLFTGRALEEEVARARTDRIHPDDVPQLQEAILSPAARQIGFQIEYRMLRGDNRWRWMLDTGSPRFHADGAFAGFIGSCLDVTDRKHAEIEHSRILEENNRLLKDAEIAATQQKVFVRDILFAVTEGKLRVCDGEAGLPAPLEAVSDMIPLSLNGGIRELRMAASTIMDRLQFTDERASDLATAIGEAAMNAVVHAGGGRGLIRTDGRDTIQVWIIDEGRGIDVEALPRAALEKGYTTAGTLGYGMKMMLGTIDRLWLLTRPTGTTVVLEQARIAQEPPWMRSDL